MKRSNFVSLNLFAFGAMILNTAPAFALPPVVEVDWIVSQTKLRVTIPCHNLSLSIAEEVDAAASAAANETITLCADSRLNEPVQAFVRVDIDHQRYGFSGDTNGYVEWGLGDYANPSTSYVEWGLGDYAVDVEQGQYGFTEDGLSSELVPESGSTYAEVDFNGYRIFGSNPLDGTIKVEIGSYDVIRALP